MQIVSLITKDGVRIAGDYYAPRRESNRGALLIHMMPATRVSWRRLAPRIEEEGMHVLAIDLRGHGESEGGPQGYTSFSDAEHKKSIFDLEAGVEFLCQKGVDREHLSLVGASIGANLVLQYGATHKVSALVLLSPGLDYRGITTLPFLSHLVPGQRVFLASSEDDERSGGSSADMTRTIAEHIPRSIDKKIVMYHNAGHGTDMFGKEDPDLEQEILFFLS